MDRLEEAASHLGVAGAVLLLIGVAVMLSGAALGATVQEGVYYYATGLTYTKVDFTEADNATSVLLVVDGVRVNVTPIFPAGSSGSVTFMISQQLTIPQVVALGASDPSRLGSVYMLVDLIVNWTVTGGTPTLIVEFEVEALNVRAYWWTGAEWALFPVQDVVVRDGVAYLRVEISMQLTGTPVALLSPSPVGGTLAFKGAEAGPGALVAAVGVAFIAASAVLYYVASKRKRGRGGAG